mmetsp:Transcript_41294/g.76911  ORF Transcript_41294/g.76911 Transcript_41294/m.76911 type:complete len:560 (+) Transcript_41294:84-1763(+)
MSAGLPNLMAGVPQAGDHLATLPPPCLVEGLVAHGHGLTRTSSLRSVERPPIQDEFMLRDPKASKHTTTTASTERGRSPVHHHNQVIARYPNPTQGQSPQARSQSPAEWQHPNSVPGSPPPPQAQQPQRSQSPAEWHSYSARRTPMPSPPPRRQQSPLYTLKGSDLGNGIMGSFGKPGPVTTPLRKLNGTYREHSLHTSRSELHQAPKECPHTAPMLPTQLTQQQLVSLYTAPLPQVGVVGPPKGSHVAAPLSSHVAGPLVVGDGRSGYATASAVPTMVIMPTTARAQAPVQPDPTLQTTWRTTDVALEAKHQQELTTYKEHLARVAQEKDEAKKLVEVKDEEVKQLKEQLKEKSVQAEEERRQIESKALNAERELKAESQARIAAREASHDLEGQNRKLEAQLESQKIHLQTEIQSFQAASQRQESELQESRRKLERLEEDNKQKHRKLMDGDKNQNAMENELQALSRERELLKLQLRDAQMQLREAQCQLGEQEKMNRVTVKTFNQWTDASEAVKLNNENIELKERVHNLEHMLTQATKQLDEQARAQRRYDRQAQA